MATPREDKGTGLPQGQRRRRINLFLGLFLAFQLATPLTYYVRDDPYDERFAWRMFSAIRMHSCRTRAVERVGDDPTVRRVDLRKTIHIAWIRLLQRNRPDVIRAFLERRCEETEVQRARIINQCVGAGGERTDPLIYTRDCATGAVEQPSPDELP